MRIKLMGQGKNLRWQRQRKKILHVAGRLFWQKGYGATTLDDIARAGRINKATIYYYFKNKAFLLFEIVCGIMQEGLENTRPLLSSALRPREKLRVLILQHTKWILSLKWPTIGQMERRNLPPRLLNEYLVLRDEYEAIFKNIIKEGIRQNEFRRLDPELYSRFILGLLNSFLNWFKPSGSLSQEEIAGQAYDFIHQSIKAPEKSKMIKR
jgi:TetR/AcrR family transcriptional regulator, cholesterol catabolism regulator